MDEFTGELSELKAIEDTFELLSKLESAVFFVDRRVASSDDDVRSGGIPEGRVCMTMADAKAQLEDIPEVGDFVEYIGREGPVRGIVVDRRFGNLDHIPGDQQVHVTSIGSMTIGYPKKGDQDDVTVGGFSVTYSGDRPDDKMAVWIQPDSGRTTLVLGTPVRILSRYRDRQP